MFIEGIRVISAFMHHVDPHILDGRSGGLPRLVLVMDDLVYSSIWIAAASLRMVREVFVL